MKLGLLEEPDTRLYLQSQRALISEEITAYFVSQVQRKTEGLIARIDQLIRQLQVVNLADIDPPELSYGRNGAVLENASISLVKTISELESSKNSEEYTRERHAIEIKLSRALRMSGEHVRALPLLEKVLKTEASTDIRRNLLLAKALCLQSLNSNAAIEVSQEIMKMAPKSAEALQASLIILERRLSERCETAAD